MKYLLFLLFFAGCSILGSSIPVPNYVPAEYTTRASMMFVVDGKNHTGTGIADRSSSNKIDLILPKGVIKLMITTCSREEFYGYPPNGVFRYTYIPVMYLENLNSCMLTATAITEKGEAFKSIVEFRNGETLKSEVSCNGQVTEETGVGLCQSRSGLHQMITFDEPVAFVVQEGCPELKQGFLSNSYTLKIGEGFCAYSFKNMAKEKFRFTTYGYTAIQEILLNGSK